MNKEQLIKKAFEAMKNSYSPYSHFPVGAAVLTKDNKVYIGANIENASFGLTSCAERNALFSAYSNGVKKKDIKALAIVSTSKEIATSCGACRQVLVELCPLKTPVYFASKNGKKLTLTVEDLLPYHFDDSNLK